MAEVRACDGFTSLCTGGLDADVISKRRALVSPSTFFMVAQELPWQKWMLICCLRDRTGHEHWQVAWWPNTWVCILPVRMWSLLCMYYGKLLGPWRAVEPIGWHS